MTGWSRQAESFELVGWRFDLDQCRAQELGDRLLLIRSGEVMILVGVLAKSNSRLRLAMPHAQNGTSSPAPNGCRMTGTSLPGIRANSARSSGRGRRNSCADMIGMVDQRFDHIDSGALLTRWAADVLLTLGADDMDLTAPHPGQRPVADRR